MRIPHLKIFFLLLAITIYISCSRSFAQTLDNAPKKISFHFSGTSVKKALRYLVEHHDLDILYVDEQLDGHAPVNANADGLSIEAALTLILKETDLTYFLMDDQIVISRKELAGRLDLDAQQRVVPVTDNDSLLSGNVEQLKLKSLSSRRTLPDKRMPSVFIRVKTRMHDIPDMQRKPTMADTLIADKKNGTGNDTVTALKDSLVIQKDGKNRQKLYKRHQTSSHLSVIADLGRTYWNGRAYDRQQVENLQRSNAYSRSDEHFALYLRYERKVLPSLSYRIGLGLRSFQRSGVHTDRMVNLAHNDNVHTRSYAYIYRHRYLMLPLGISYRTVKGKITALIAADIDLNLFLWSNMEVFHVYETMYYSNMFHYDSRSPFAGHYFNRQYQPIQPRSASFRNIVPAFAFRPEVRYALSSRSALYAGGNLCWFMWNIYKADAPVREVPVMVSFSIGFAYKLN